MPASAKVRVCLAHSLGLESVSGLGLHALLVDVATKVLADNLAALLNRAVPTPSDSPEGVSRQVNRAAASELFSRWFGGLPKGVQVSGCL